MRLKVYMTVCLRAVKTPHDVVVVPYKWAEMLGLPENETNGARRIKAALKWLAQVDMIRVERKAGLNPAAYLLAQSGPGGPYHRP